MGYQLKVIDIEFNKETIIGTRPLTKRPSLVVFNENIPIAEASILPGFHSYDLEMAKSDFNKLLNNNLELPESERANYLPSTLLLFDQIEMFDKNDSPVEENIILNGLFDPSLHKIENFLEFSSLKVKLKRQAFEKDLELLKTLDQELPIHSKLRLDANRKLTLDEFNEVSIQFKHRIDYFEEPFNSYNNLDLSFIAFDESFYELDLNKVIHLAPKAVVLKPSLYGGYVECKKLIKTLREKNIQTIISSTYETKLGLRLLKNLAQISKVPAGLDTLKDIKDSL